jgi:hypothetical protein
MRYSPGVWRGWNPDEHAWPVKVMGPIDCTEMNRLAQAELNRRGLK